MNKAFVLLSAGVLGLSGCDDSTAPPIEAPQNLFYVLDASGDPLAPSGVLLSWDPVLDGDLEAYNVYSSLDGVQFDLRGTTTSLTFHDVDVPDLVYFVRAVERGGDESFDSEHITIDERLRLDGPDWLESTTLDGAVHLIWSDNPFQNEPDGFRRYRIYSDGSYSLDDPVCDGPWVLEGTTVSPEFLVSDLANGGSLCFGVSAESIEGWESLWSPFRADTPRPDARNVVVFRDGFDPDLSGFRFFFDANGDRFAGPTELGIVTRGDGATIDVDFRVIDVGGTLFLEPVRTGTLVALYSVDPVEDLTSIDLAPETGFLDTAIEAVPGFGYVFEMDGDDAFARFGGLRVTHVGSDFLIFDWSYQTDPGNPELRRHGGLPTADERDLEVHGVQ